jgi:hypothetical protein
VPALVLLLPRIAPDDVWFFSTDSTPDRSIDCPG